MANKPSKLRFSVTQILLLAALVALFVGAGSTAWRDSQLGDPVWLAVSPDGKRVAVASRNPARGTVQLWDLSESRRRRVSTDIGVSPIWFGGNPITFVDSHTLAGFREDSSRGELSARVEKWDVRSGRTLGEIQLPQPPLIVVFAEGGTTFATFSMADNVIEIWGLRSEQVLSRVAVKSRPEEVQLSADGRFLMVTDSMRDAVKLYDTRTGQLARTLPLDNKSSQVFISSRGKWIATIDLLHDTLEGGAGQWRTEVRIHDVTGEKTATSFEPGNYTTSLVFAPDDETLLCVLEGQGSQRYDVKTGELLVTLGDEQQTGKHYVFTSDGEQLVDLSQGQLTFWDPETGRRTRTIWRTNATLHVLLFAGGFILWACAWGWLSRRQRPSSPPWPSDPTVDSGGQPSSQSKPPAPAAAAAPPLPPAATLAPPSPSTPGRSKRPPSLLRSLGLLTLIMVLVMVLLTLSNPGPLPQRIAIVIGGTVGLVVLAIVAAAGYVVLRELFTPGYGPQLSRAVQVAGRQGRLAQQGRYAAWFVGESMLESVLPDELAKTEANFRELFGACEFQREAFILSFDNHDQFQRYAGRRLPLAGVYYGWFKKQLVLCETYALESLTDPRHILRSLLGYHLLLEYKGFWLPPWVQGVLNAHLMADLRDPHAVRCTHRRLRLALREDRLTMTSWFTWNRRQLAQAVLQRDPVAAAREALLVYDMGQSLALYLLGPEAGERRERFTRFVVRLGKRDSVEEALREQFSADYDTLQNEWKVWLLEQPVTSHEQPPGWRHRRLVEQTLKTVRDPTVEPTFRARQISSLGAAGYLATAEWLIQRLRQPDEPQRGEIVTALENIAGQPLGDDPEAWQAWWERQDEASRTLPPLVLGDPDADSANARGPCYPGAPRRSTASPVSTLPPASTLPPVSTAPPLSTAPQPAWMSAGGVPTGVRQARVLMLLGGLVAVFLAMWMLFEGNLWWLPTLYYGVAVGIIAIAHAVSRSPRGMRTVAWLQIGNLVSCDLLNLLLGISELVLLNHRSAKQYLHAARRPQDKGSKL